jgi:hypothetical protein
VHATHDAINFFVLPLMKICLGMQATGTPRASRGAAKGGVTVVTEEMLSQKNVESVLLRGKKVAEQTNAEKLERFAHELVKERDRRRTSAITPAAVHARVRRHADGVVLKPRQPNAHQHHVEHHQHVPDVLASLAFPFLFLCPDDFCKCV